MPAPVYRRVEYTPLGCVVRVEQEHQMHQMAIYSGVYTEETRPLKPIVSEVIRCGVSEESDGCLGPALFVWAPGVITRLGKRVVSCTLRQPGDRPIRVGAQRNPGRMEGADCTSLPANAQSDQPRGHSARTFCFYN